MKLSVIKIGGHVIDDQDALLVFLKSFVKVEGRKILVHGGGKVATEMAARLGVASEMIEGRRVTSPAMRDVAVMVYAGLVNKRIVAALQSLGCNAVGLSGADGMAVEAHRRNPAPIDYGEVGDVDRVNVSLLDTLLQAGITPVMCAITCDGAGNLLNTNADTIAMEAAKACSGGYFTRLIYCFEKNGVLRDVNDDSSVITNINSESYNGLKACGVVSAGMLPKIENALKALSESDISEVVIRNYNNLHVDSGTVISR